MKKNDFIEQLQKILEIENVELSEETNLKEIEDFVFDSMAVMGLIALIHEHFNKKFAATKLNNITTIKSLMELIGLKDFT